MVFITEDIIKQFRTMMEKTDEPLKKTFQNIHQGYPIENLVRFLKARDGNVSNAYKMLIDCLNWRIQNEIDNILAKPIIPSDLYRAIRDSQLAGMSGYSKEVRKQLSEGSAVEMTKNMLEYVLRSCEKR